MINMIKWRYCVILSIDVKEWLCESVALGRVNPSECVFLR